MTDYNADKVRELAARYVDQFEPLERTEHFSTYKRKDDVERELQELCYAAHGDMMPDDYKYNFIVDALSLIADSSTDELQDLDGKIESDVYNSDLLKWLSSNLTRASYVDNYVEAFGIESKDFEFYKVVGGGQWLEKSEVFCSVLSSLIKLVTKMEEENDDDDEV